ncbi:MAG: hypothetical protein NTV70_12775 [Acidobacteria bacterium]|nr:hypothetical protein [Acidobacteriota bacterium]
MKSFVTVLALCLLLSPLGDAQEFTTGQAARLLIGQPTFTQQEPGPPSNLVLGAASGLAVANNMLFVADSSRVGAAPDNNRVLIYRNLSSFIPAPTAEFPQTNERCPACVGLPDVVVGQKDFKGGDFNLQQWGMRNATAVASDGTVLAVADTDFNRILIWNRIPTTNGQPADVVLGQNNFTTIRQISIDNKSLRGPQGIWIQNGRLFVADTMNHRVLIWNRIPTANDAPADVVLGQPNFGVAPQPDLTKASLNAQANTMLNPFSVSSDGVRLLVSDLGHQRVLIWNSLPTSNQQAADLVLGQPDFASATSNNSTKLCDSDGKNDKNEPTYPVRCAATIEYPRGVLSDGRRLFVVDGGNDRVLIWKTFPTRNGQPADVVLGQVSATLNNTSDSAFPDKVAGADVLRGPSGLAFDGNNLYVSDTFNRRVLVFTPGDPKVPYTGVRNSASREVFAVGGVTIGGVIKADDEITLKINSREYKYKVLKDDTFKIIMTALVNLINAGSGDPDVLALPNQSISQVILSARTAGEAGNAVTLEVTLSTGATVTATTTGASLTGGQDAARLAPGTVVSIVGERLAERTVSAPESAQVLPRELGGVKVYIDGIQVPLLMVSPNQINAQLPWEVAGAQSSNAVVRTEGANGVTVSSAIAVPLIAQNPGIYATDGPDPRPGVIFHGSSFATGTVSVDGTSKKDDVATIVIADRSYSYKVEEDTVTNGGLSDNQLKLAKIRDNLIRIINANGGDPDVVAYPAGVFTRIRLQARRPGPDLNGLPIAAKVSDTASVILTATNSSLCCANTEGAPVNAQNPALPGETLIVYATGLGKIKPEEAQRLVRTGQVYNGPADNEPEEFVSSLAGAKTANVLFARLKPGMIGIYEVVLELNSDLPTNDTMQLTIAQSFQVSNIVTIPLKNPND